MIVDDVPENIEVLYQVLKGEHKLVGATSGKQALEMAALHCPDLILLDVMMPEMDGYEVCSALKSDDKTVDIPVIFITAKTDAESEKQALSAGAVDFIHKPFDTGVVLTRVKLHLELAQNRKRLENLNQQLEQSLAEIKLVQSRLEVLSTAIEQSPTSVVITGADAVIQYVNPHFTLESGFTSAEAIGHNPSILKSGLTNPETYRDLWMHLERGESWTGEFVNRRKSGEIYWEEAHIAPVKDANGAITHYVAVNLDISERKEAQQHLAYMAHHDALTNLPNRTLFFEKVEQGLALAKRNQTRLALMYIDLDKFKPINDNHGHAAGDLVLKEVAKRLCNCIRESDSVSRIGGDEFVVLLLDVGSEDAAVLVAEKIRYSLNQPFDIAQKMLSISSSIGVAIYPEHGSDAIELAGNADCAMYLAKEQGRDNVKVFMADIVEMNSGRVS
ncbi:diguanylate cyclase domain-containing protein [uncultured Desulfobulbus sp.]|uniref:diguanylate cyclase domain-containing protein n=1 Tax=uncultured Desulfobulbus sp. TaxID=239745 RepID=UPI0029C6F6F8|nr:diguanylate cyclase [uncultured Desulfobulbus sp.]